MLFNSKDSLFYLVRKNNLRKVAIFVAIHGEYVTFFNWKAKDFSNDPWIMYYTCLITLLSIKRIYQAGYPPFANSYIRQFSPIKIMIPFSFMW